MVKDGLYYAFGFTAAGAVLTYVSGAAWAAPCFLLAGFCLYFFRDPHRAIPDGPVAVSPADGKVVQIRSMEDGRRRVSIFLNIFNVHVNRIPVSGRITEQRYRPGQFRMANLEAASLANEQNSLTIESGGARLVVNQIAGLIARRIVCNKRLGDTVLKGERFGWIKFGSRIDLYLGPEWDLDVRPGDKVKGGSSIIAHRQDQAA